jgi:hypothetical protein
MTGALTSAKEEAMVEGRALTRTACSSTKGEDSAYLKVTYSSAHESRPSPDDLS